MPWAVLVFMLMPFGLEGFALTPMFWGIEVVLKTAQLVSQWPGAAITLPAMSTEALLSVTCGLLWLCLWRSRWGLFGTVGIAAGLATLLLYRAPDILVDGDAKLMAVRLVNGQYAVTSLRQKKYTREVWLRRIGHSGPPVPWPKKKIQEIINFLVMARAVFTGLNSMSYLWRFIQVLCSKIAIQPR